MTDRTSDGNPIADRTRHQWRVEAREADGEWVWVSSASRSVKEAQAKRGGVLARFPGATTRIIRVTETHTVEPDQATHDGCDGTHVRSASGSIVLCDKEGISTDGR